MTKLIFDRSFTLNKQGTARKIKQGAASDRGSVDDSIKEMELASSVIADDAPLADAVAVDTSAMESEPGVLPEGEAGQKLMPEDKPPEPNQEPNQVPNQALLQSPIDALGQVVQLMLRSPAHRHLFLADLEWLVLPPLALRQCRVVRKKQENGVAAPVAYISWAWLSEKTEQRISASGMGGIRLQGDEWNAKLRGDEDARPWIIDVIAPFGGADKLIDEVKKNVFGGAKVKALRPAPSGGGMAVVEW
jgi:cytolysin-activating lysine-acyltransferase